MITVGLLSSICAYASRSACMSCPPRLPIALTDRAVVQFGDQAPDGLAVLAGPRQAVA